MDASAERTDRARALCRFQQADCLDDEAAVLQLLRRRGANKALVDIGGNRAGPALAAILSALQHAGIQWIYVKCEALLEAALDHMHCIDAAGAWSGGRQALCGGAVPRDAMMKAEPAHLAGGRTARNQAHASCGGATAEQSGAACAETPGGAGPMQPEAKRGVASQERSPSAPCVLWRWRKQPMPRAWDLRAAADVREAGLVSESLAVISQAEAWWDAQVRHTCSATNVKTPQSSTHSRASPCPRGAHS